MVQIFTKSSKERVIDHLLPATHGLILRGPRKKRLAVRRSGWGGRQIATDASCNVEDAKSWFDRSMAAPLDYFGLLTIWPRTVKCDRIRFCVYIYFGNPAHQMGLTQSSEVSDGGTYGYHVHGVRFVVTQSVCLEWIVLGEGMAAYLSVLSLTK